MSQSKKIFLYFALFAFGFHGELVIAESVLMPQNQLAPEIIEYFYPKILEELEKEFSQQNDQRTHRNTLEYGYSFFKMENNDFSYTTPPEFYNELGYLVCECLGNAPQEFTNIILSVYEEGFHLEPHIDINATDHTDKVYYFDENVYGVIIEADSTGHLYIARDDKNRIPPLNIEAVYSVEEKLGTVFCLQGQFRKAPYFHGVTSVTNRRISITFRKVIIKS